MSNENEDKFQQLRNEIKGKGILSAEQAVIDNLKKKGFDVPASEQGEKALPMKNTTEAISDIDKAKMIADQCKPCTDDFYSGIYQGVLLTIDAIKNEHKKQ